MPFFSRFHRKKRSKSITLPVDRSSRSVSSVSTASLSILSNPSGSPHGARRQSFLDYLRVREPSLQALKQYEEDLMKQQNRSNRPSAIGMPMVPAAKLPGHVPKTNSKWNGMPEHMKRQKKVAKPHRDDNSSLSLEPTGSTSSLSNRTNRIFSSIFSEGSKSNQVSPSANTKAGPSKSRSVNQWQSKDLGRASCQSAPSITVSESHNGEPETLESLAFKTYMATRGPSPKSGPFVRLSSSSASESRSSAYRGQTTPHPPSIHSLDEEPSSVPQTPESGYVPESASTPQLSLPEEGAAKRSKHKLVSFRRQSEEGLPSHPSETGSKLVRKLPFFSENVEKTTKALHPGEKDGGDAKLGLALGKRKRIQRFSIFGT